MKRFKNLVIGGIQSKIFNLILFTVILLTAAFIAVSLVNGSMLSKVVTESGELQQESIAETTDSVMDQVVTTTLKRANRSEAKIADGMFGTIRNSVEFLSDQAAYLFAHQGEFAAKPYEGPDPEKDGICTAKVIYADGTSPADRTVMSKLGLIANLSDMMISLCESFDAATVYIAFPEGVHYSVSEVSSDWLEDGRVRSYDPRTRGWYQQAVEAGKLIFTEGEKDAATGIYCIECAKPVYGPDGTLQAVVGADLFLDEIERVLKESAVEGEYALLVSETGHAVLTPQEEAFPMDSADRGGDLRRSKHEMLANITGAAINGFASEVLCGELADGTYYMTASPIEKTGWVLISAYREDITGKAGEILQEKLTSIQEESRALYREKNGNSRVMTLVLLAAVMFLTLGGALTLGRHIVHPLNIMTKRITELNEENLEFMMEDTYRTGDEVEKLAETFAAISHKTVQYMDEVVKVTAEKERIGTELSLATDIQAAMLPHIFPAFPNRPDFDIYASMDPAKEVGGDFYDYFLIDDDHLGMVIADVSGKGVPAALFMMASKIILQSVAMLGNSPAEILAKTNQALCTNNEAEMFVTVWLGILELSTGKLTAANAGHEYPVLKQPGRPYELYRDRHGFIIGGMETARYKEYEIILEPGAKLFVYTDGVPEATNAQEEMFGTERMVEALNAQPDARPQDVLHNVRIAVNAFVKDAEPFDDLTMLCMEYVGPAAGSGDDPESV